MFDGLSTSALLLYVILLLVALIVLTLLVLLVQSGLFYSVDEVKTGKPPVGQLIIAYKFSRGPYNQAGQLFTEAAIIAPDNKKIGIYYDDPKKVDAGNLRYVVGSILSEGTVPVNKEMVKTFTNKGFQIIHLPEVTYGVFTKFPHITTLSILIAVHKVYPRLQAYIEEHKLCAYPFLEYYDGNTIHFWAPLSKQEEFFVPECEVDAGGDQLTEGETTLLSNTTCSSEDDLDLLVSQDEEEPGKPACDTLTETSTVITSTPGSTADTNDANNSGNAEDNSVQPLVRDEGHSSDDSTGSFEFLKTD